MINEWLAEIDLITQNFSTFRALSSDELNWKPSSDSWSIAQNIDHLIVINRSYFSIIDSIRAGQYNPSFFSKFGFLVRFFGNTILKSVRPERTKRTNTFPIWEPASSEITDDIINRFETHQSELKTIIQHSRDLIEEGVVISSPVNRNIVYKLETAIEIIINHEKRHFAQSIEVLELMKHHAPPKT